MLFIRAQDLVNQLRKKAQFFRHNHVLFPFGDDFRFYDRAEWAIQFGNLTRLMDYINSNLQLNVQVWNGQTLRLVNVIMVKPYFGLFFNVFNEQILL
jgi:Glycosyl hydrolases family 38 N-terminal domain